MATTTVLNQNQFGITPVLGSLVQGVPQNVKSVRINPASTATIIVAGQAVKLSDVAGAEIMVDVVASATSDKVYGVIAYNPKKNTYVKGDFVEIACAGSVVWLETSAAIARGAAVATDYTGPTVAANAVASNQLTGICLSKPTATGQLAMVEIAPATNPAS
jgi:hypothetical protein